MKRKINRSPTERQMLHLAKCIGDVLRSVPEGQPTAHINFRVANWKLVQRAIRKAGRSK